jgi:hypothetical protein
MCPNVVKSALRFAAFCGGIDCARFLDIIEAGKFEKPKKRTAAPDADEVIRTREAAHESKRPAIAFGIALQFEGSIRQWDGADGWLPMSIEEIDRIPDERRVGPLIVCENTRRPCWREQYANWWRKAANKAGVPIDLEPRHQSRRRHRGIDGRRQYGRSREARCTCPQAHDGAGLRSRQARGGPARGPQEVSGWTVVN